MQAAPASTINHRLVETNGIRMHVAEAGAGPLAVLCHGFPESWYSWRHQLVALAGAGFHAVFYQLYFQEPGVAEADLERDPRASIHRLLHWASGEARDPRARTVDAGDVGMVPRAQGLVASRPDPGRLPAWFTEADLDFYAGEFTRTGFRGGLNWYRNIDRNWELLAPWAGATIAVPALYVAGDRDLVLAFRGMDQLLPALAKFVPNLRRTLILPGCGHWTQQERPGDVNAALLEFLGQLG